MHHHAQSTHLAQLLRSLPALAPLGSERAQGRPYGVRPSLCFNSTCYFYLAFFLHYSSVMGITHFAVPG